jgi:hypothetical protein
MCAKHRFGKTQRTNLNEGSLFAREMKGIIPTLSDPLAPGDMELMLNHFFGTNATVNALVDSLYPLSAFGNATDQAATMIRDFFFLCPTSRALLGLNSFQSQTWLYQFTYKGDWIEDVRARDIQHAHNNRRDRKRPSPATVSLLFVLSRYWVCIILRSWSSCSTMVRVRTHSAAASA